MTIPTFDTEIEAAPPAPQPSDTRLNFQNKAALFVSWQESFSVIMESFRVYINGLGTEVSTEITAEVNAGIASIEASETTGVNSVNSATTSGLADIQTAKDDVEATATAGVASVNSATASGLTDVQSAIDTAAANAAAGVESATLGDDVYLAASGAYTMPLSPSANDRINFYITGDVENNPAIITMNGHKFMGETETTIEFDLNVSASFYYVDTTYGWGIK